MTLTCPLCPLRGFPSVSALLTHIRLMHSDQPNFLLQCNLQGCCRTFTNFLTYRNHVYAFHGTNISEDVVSQEDTTVTDDDAMDTEEPASSDVEKDKSRKCINLYNTIILL